MPTIALLLTLPAMTPARADEGIWTFDAFPADLVKAAYGVDIDEAWRARVMKGSVALSSGCSASLVSGQGLVLTANHCVAECAQALTTPGEDYYSRGYLAGRAGEEKRCAMTADILTSITDVTARVAASMTPERRQEVRTQIEQAACPDRVRTTCRVTAMYDGAQYKLYKYRRYDDVRLVFSPGVAAQGLQSIRSPGFNFDAAFLRLFEDGRPAVTPDHLRWNDTAPKAGDPVFVAGSPRISERLLTVTQLATMREATLPYLLVRLAEHIGWLTRFGQESEANRQASQYKLDDLRNYYSVNLDFLDALNSEPFFASKVAGETDFRAKAGPAAQSSWNAIDAAELERRRQARTYEYLVDGPSSRLFTHARILVRSATERLKASAQRLPAYSDARLAGHKATVLDDQPLYMPFEQLELEFWLDTARRYMAADEASTELLLGRETSSALAARLATSKLGDVAVRRRLWDGGLPAILASDDPMIRFMLRIDPAARAVQARWAATVTGPQAAAAAQISKARFAAYGTRQYPDANHTLRLSYGAVAGVAGVAKTPPFTTIGGMFERAKAETPYRLDPRWLAARDRLDPATILNLSTTNDGINGNSGSPLIDARGTVVGVFFGGNSAAMGGNYGYDPTRNRAVAVSAEGISEILKKVYGGDAVVEELGTSRHQGQAR